MRRPRTDTRTVFRHRPFDLQAGSCTSTWNGDGRWWSAYQRCAAGAPRNAQRWCTANGSGSSCRYWSRGPHLAARGRGCSERRLGPRSTHVRRGHCSSNLAATAQGRAGTNSCGVEWAHAVGAWPRSHTTSYKSRSGHCCGHAASTRLF